MFLHPVQGARRNTMSVSLSEVPVRLARSPAGWISARVV